MDKYIRSMSFNMIHLCIDDYENYKIKGRAYNNTRQEVICFNDINDIFIQFDRIFDDNGQPQASQSSRSFTHPKPLGRYQFRPETYNDYDEFLNEVGKKATLDLVIKSRKRSTWQGIIIYNGQEIAFVSILEMLNYVISFIES